MISVLLGGGYLPRFRRYNTTGTCDATTNAIPVINQAMVPSLSCDPKNNARAPHAKVNVPIPAMNELSLIFRGGLLVTGHCSRREGAGEC